jgi:hypothetical protein
LQKVALDIKQIFLGKLVYDLPIPALDEVRFERIRRGFGQHYLLPLNSPNMFSFERGEGFLSFGRTDAFAAIDKGEIIRLRSDGPETTEAGPNVFAFRPLYGALHCALNIRVILALWLMLFIISYFIVGGDWLFWIVGFFAVYGVHIALVRWSLKTKINEWLARESWN